jgi:hypothetical protein
MKRAAVIPGIMGWTLAVDDGDGPKVRFRSMLKHECLAKLDELKAQGYQTPKQKDPEQ